jgi:tetratricopeptide (TPR) repeat protein
MCLSGSNAGTNYVSVPDSSQNPLNRPALVNHRARLILPQADLSQLELTVQQRLRAGEANLASLITQPTVSEKHLAEAYGHLGSLFHAHGLSESAMACYQSAQSHAPQAYRWPYLIGYLHQQNGQLERAADSYERALHLNPNYVQVKLRLAQVYLNLNRMDQADTKFQEVLAERGLEAAAAFGLGKLALSRRRFAEAIEWFQDALSHQPHADRINYPLAMAYRGLGNTIEAQHYIRESGETDPTFPDSILEEIQALESGVRAHIQRALKALAAHQIERAAREFQAAVTLDPDNVATRVRLARTLHQQGNLTRAREELLTALAREPDNVSAHYYLGLLVEEEGDEEDAIEHYQKALIGDPQHPGAHFYLANALLRRGAAANAARHYAKVVELTPQNRLARLFEAIALVRATRTHGKARDLLEEGLAAYPEDPRFVQALARLLAASPDAHVRDGAQALGLSRKLYAQFPIVENAETLAMAHAELGQFKQAIALQEEALEMATGFGRFDLVSRLQENLQNYKSSEPSRTPWTDQDPLYLPPPIKKHKNLIN